MFATLWRAGALSKRANARDRAKVGVRTAGTEIVQYYLQQAHGEKLHGLYFVRKDVLCDLLNNFIHRDRLVNDSSQCDFFQAKCDRLEFAIL